jgi:hypothetical protein
MMMTVIVIVIVMMMMMITFPACFKFSWLARPRGLPPLINSTINYALHHRRPDCSLSRIIARLCGRALAAAAGTPLPSHAASLSHFTTHALLLRPPPLTSLTPPNTRQTPLSYLPPTYDIFGVPPSSIGSNRGIGSRNGQAGERGNCLFLSLNQASATPPSPSPSSPLQPQSLHIPYLKLARIILQFFGLL